MNFRPQRRILIGLELTPLIDVTFQLILFFMVSTNFNESPGIEVELPQASTEKILREANDIEIWLTADGGIFVEQQAVSKTELRVSISTALEANPNVLVMIKADETATHERVVAIMDMAQELGVQKLSIGTKRD
jgi:biopolymer transport protein ExbD